jgi:hypothetical protein
MASSVKAPDSDTCDPFEVPFWIDPFDIPYKCVLLAWPDMPIEYSIDPTLPYGSSWIACHSDRPNQVNVAVFSEACRSMMRMA